MAKTKEPIKLRFENLKNGNQSIFLDTYYNGQRHKERLHLYLIPESKGNRIAKEQNKQTLLLAQKIKAEKLNELLFNGKIKTHSVREKEKFAVWATRYIKERQDIKLNTKRCYKKTIRIISIFAPNLKFSDITSDFLDRFFDWLLYEYKTPKGNAISSNWGRGIMSYFHTLCRNAYHCKMINKDPFANKEFKFSKTDQKIKYLTTTELNQIEKCEFREDIKNAFLFACYTGLRYSDIFSLVWENIVNINGKLWIEKKTIKTERIVKIPLGHKATQILVKQDQTKKNVFTNVPYATIQRAMKKLAKSANLNVDLTFHVARHTFATLLVRNHVDLIVVRDLLGHSKIDTTQIYAKVVGEQLENAISTLD